MFNSLRNIPYIYIHIAYNIFVFESNTQQFFFCLQIFSTDADFVIYYEHGELAQVSAIFFSANRDVSLVCSDRIITCVKSGGAKKKKRATNPTHALLAI